MNWGTKLIIGMLLFMSFIVVLGVLMFRSETDALVEKDYYEKGLNYDKDYEQKVSVVNDQAKPVITLEGKQLDISFNTEATGTIKMIRSSDKDMDKLMDFQTSDKTVQMDVSKLAPGRWKLIIKWQNTTGTEYLSEQEAMIP